MRAAASEGGSEAGPSHLQQLLRVRLQVDPVAPIGEERDPSGAHELPHQPRHLARGAVLVQHVGRQHDVEAFMEQLRVEASMRGPQGDASGGRWYECGRG